MFRILCGFCLILITAFSSGAQIRKDEKSLLWRISGKELKQPSWLFGTIHLISSDDYIWTEQMKYALDQSNKVCFELDLDDPNMLAEIAGGMAGTSNPSVRDELNAIDYARLKRYFKDSLHVDLAAVEGLGSTALSTLLLGSLLNCDDAISYEQKILDQALTAKKEIIGLEKVSEQLSVLDSITADSGGKELLALIDSLPLYRAQYAKMISYYRNQDLQSLCEWIKNSDLPMEPMDVLLDTRNKKWISRMKPLLAQSSVFFAVGAAHLCGPNGVIALLRAAGYTVTELP